MNLGRKVDDQERAWELDAEKKLDELIKILSNDMEIDLYKENNKSNSVELFSYLRGFLLAHYYEGLCDAIRKIDIDPEIFDREMIFSLILGIIRNSKSVSMQIEFMIKNGIIKEVYELEDHLYRIETVRYGNIDFKRADEVFDDELFKSDNLSDGCHEYGLEFLKNHHDVVAVTGVAIRDLCLSYYHTYIEIEDEVVDVANNLLIGKEDFFKINDFQELNRVTYEEYQETSGDSVEYDESKTLYDLLRMAVYKEEQKCK